MNHFRRFLTIAALALPSLHAADVGAQQSGNLFNEQFVNVFDPESRTYFSMQSMQGNQFGGQQPYSSVGVSHYFGSIDSSVTLYTGRILVNNNGNPAGTLGAQYRWLTQLGPLNTTILGAGAYLDLNQSRYNNLFEQVNLNFELMTESAWVARLNGYLPVGEIQQQTGIQSQAGGPNGQLTLVGTQVWAGNFTQQLLDVALMGSDLEVGRKFFGYRAEAYGGYYTWNGPLVGFTSGVKGGVRGFITDNLSGNINVSHDSFFGTNVYGGLMYTFGGRGGNRPLSFLNLMTLPVQRAQQVSIADAVRTSSSFHAAVDAATGDQLHVYFVDQGGTGTGVRNDASNVNSVLGNSSFGHGSAMVLLGDTGSITSSIALTQDRQQVIGGGTTGVANIDFSQALGQAAGTSVLHLSGLGSQAILSPTSGNAITLMNQDVIQGFTIDGLNAGLVNGIAGPAGGANGVTISNMTIQNLSGVGIQLDSFTGAASIANTTISGTGLSGLSITNSASLTATIQNIDIHNVGTLTSDNGATLSNAGNVTFTGGSIDKTAGDGINSTDTNLTVTGMQLGASGGIATDGIEVDNSGSAHTVNLSNNDVTGGSSGISVRDLGNLVLTLDGNTMQSLSSGTLALDVHGFGSSLNPTILQSMNGGTVLSNGLGGGVKFTNVVFDASGAALQGRQVNAGTWTIGSSSTFRVQGDGLNFTSTTGSVSFSTLNIANNNGNGTWVNNSASAQTLAIGGGTIDTTNGDAIRLTDALSFSLNNTTVNQTVGYTINSTNSVLSGTGNTAAVFSGHDGTGNSGIISFNGGANLFP